MAKKKIPSERTIEKKVCDYARARGWMTPKWASPGYRGVPDRLFLKDGHWIAVEFKRPGGKCTKLQEIVQGHLIEHGANVDVIDSVEQGKQMVDAYDRYLTHLNARIDRELAAEERPALVSAEGQPLRR